METNKKDSILGEEQKHESFGLMQFSRTSSSPSKKLFGSSIKHSKTITLTICEATKMRSPHSCDRYYDENQLIEVEMSSAQFAEAMTTLNYGVGVPVTLRRVMGKNMNDCPEENKREQHSREFKERMEEFAEKIKKGQIRLQELTNKQTLSKADKHELNTLYGSIAMEIRSNIPFFEKQFEEQMDTTVMEAKSEVDAFITSAIVNTGLKALKDNQGLIQLPE